MENDENELIVKDDEELEQTNETENVDTQTTEENVEQTDTEVEETLETGKEQKKTLAELLRENPDLQEEFNATMKRRLNRQKDSINREYEEKYGDLERTLEAGLGTNNLEESKSKLKDYYKEQGVQIQESPKYSDRDLEILARAEASEIISSGYEDIVDEVDRLADKGVDKMTQREKLVFQQLAEERKKQESIKELAAIGVDKVKLEDKKFVDFAKMLNPDLSTKEKYEMYLKLNPKETPEPIGSMKNEVNKKGKVKEFYTPEEARKFTEEDLKNNPGLEEAIERSMQKW